MENQNNYGQSRPRFCKKCGGEISPDTLSCVKCGFQVRPYPDTTNTVLINADSSVNEPVNYAPVNYSPVNYGADFAQQNNYPEPPKKDKKKLIIPIAILSVISVIAIVFGVLVATHTICLKHEFSDADCTKAKTCRYCSKTEGEALGHEWSEGSCTEAKVCKRCDEEGEPAKGHVRGDWTVKKAPTLTEKGVEEAVCTVCSESLDERDIDKKMPQVSGASFNFKDDEFVDWIEDTFSGTTLVKMDSEDSLTAYNADFAGDEGLIILDHDAKGNVSAIWSSFDDFETSVVIPILIGEELDSGFSSYSAATAIAYDGYYSAAGMTLFTTTYEGFDVAILAPDAYYEDTQTA